MFLCPSSVQVETAAAAVLSTCLFRLVGHFQQEAGVVMQELEKEKFLEWGELLSVIVLSL